MKRRLTEATALREDYFSDLRDKADALRGFSERY